MVTLIAVYSGDGECLGRCDAHCYDASEPRCTCICKGANHGAGKERAMQNTRDACEAWLEDYAEEHPFSEVEIPALYTARSRTATKIARTINANCETAGNNVVLDVRRVLRPQSGWGWEVDEKDDFPTPIRTWFYPSLRAVVEGRGQMKMSPGVNALIKPRPEQATPKEVAPPALGTRENPLDPTKDDFDLYQLLQNRLTEKTHS